MVVILRVACVRSLFSVCHVRRASASDSCAATLALQVLGAQSDTPFLERASVVVCHAGELILRTLSCHQGAAQLSPRGGGDSEISYPFYISAIRKITRTYR